MAAPLTGKARARERERQALALVLAGASVRQAAEQLDVAPSTVSRAIRRVLDATAQEVKAGADTLRAQELARLDALQIPAWRKAQAGDMGAARVVIRIIERRCRLLGLDAPVRVTVTTELDEEIDALLAQLSELPVPEEPQP